MKSNVFLSYLYIVLTYALALCVAILLMYSLRFELWLNILIADIVGTVVVFIASLMVGNASVYDPYWSVAPFVVAVAMFVSFADINFITIATLSIMLLWSTRLTANWAYTFKNLTHQDWRYTMLKEKTGKFFILVDFFGIMLFPTLVVYCCMLPMIELFTLTTFSYWSIVGLVVALVGIALEFFADIQIHRFRNGHERGEIIRIGLWKHSRHPNYLGEITFWWGIYLICLLSANHSWYLFFGTLINTLMFLFISVPMAERRMANYKNGFEEYKKQTRMLFPISK